MSSLRCPTCQSDQVIRDCRLVGKASSYNVQLEADTGVQGAPDSWWDKKPVSAAITRCHVCGTCGLVMPCVEAPADLLAAYRAAPR